MVDQTSYWHVNRLQTICYLIIIIITIIIIIIIMDL